jgi:hypothetical protein
MVRLTPPAALLLALMLKTAAGTSAKPPAPARAGVARTPPL